MVGEIAGAAGSAIGTIIAAGVEAPTMVIAGITAVFGFATLLVRSVLAQQRESNEALELEKDQSHYLRWENDTLRFRFHERELDPGPYVPRRPITPKPAPVPAPAPEPAP